MDSKIESTLEASAHGTGELERATRGPPARHQSRDYNVSCGEDRHRLSSRLGQSLFLSLFFGEQSQRDPIERIPQITTVVLSNRNCELVKRLAER
jgi:hypothetical protein